MRDDAMSLKLGRILEAVQREGFPNKRKEKKKIQTFIVREGGWRNRRKGECKVWKAIFQN